MSDYHLRLLDWFVGRLVLITLLEGVAVICAELETARP